MTKLSVLIVGAGPTGLMMACALAQSGINFRIIDKKPKPTFSSNATWIQTRTMEILNQMGILDRFIDIGHACNAINLYMNGKTLTPFSLKYIDSIYRFVLMLPQSKTEKILEDFLKECGYIIERSTELIDVVYDESLVTSTIKFSDENTETITSNWLIGCDGANGIVREKCGLHFKGENLPEQFIVADATIDFSHLSKDEIHFFFDEGTVLAAFPLGTNRYRLAANLHLNHPRQNFYKQEVIELVQERAGGKYYVSDVDWISPFWIHGKVADNMQKGPILLAGDASHIHSPAAGQGMNTGMQDAYNLAWKLASVIRKKAKPALVESYQIERYPVIKEIVQDNEHFTRMALFHKNFLSKLNKFSEELSESKDHDLEKKFGDKLTQLDIQYKNSPVIDYQHESGLLHPGQRFPDMYIGETTLYSYFDPTQHVILFFTGKDAANNTLEKIGKLQKETKMLHSDLVTSFIVSGTMLDNQDTIIDPEWKLHDAFKITKPVIFIVRPDTHISFYSEQLNIEPVRNFLNTLFT